MKNYKFTVYHNNRCSKSHCALTHLDEKNAEYEIVGYSKNPSNADQIAELLSQRNSTIYQLA